MPRIFLSLCLFLVLIFAKHQAFAQTDPLEHYWYNEEKSAKIHVYKAKDGKFYGRITWLKVPDRDGKPKLDEKNPNSKLRSEPIIGLLILKGFKKSSDNHYDGGTIYDPKNGKTYSCKMALHNNKLDVRGYVGLSMIGRTTTWTIAD